MLVFDLETTGLLEDPKAHTTVASAFNTDTEQFSFYGEGRQSLKQLVTDLRRADFVGGYNIRKFDLPMLERDTKVSLEGLMTIDPFAIMLRETGRYTSLDKVLAANWPHNDALRKSDKGSDALVMAAEGRWSELRSYCALDVYLETLTCMTMVQSGLLTPSGKLVTIQDSDLVQYKTSLAQAVSTDKVVLTDWETKRDLVVGALDSGKRVEVEYSSSAYTSKREISAVTSNGVHFTAMCSKRKELTNFRWDRVVSAVIIGEAA